MRPFTIISTLIVVAISGVTATPIVAVATLFARQTSTVPDIPDECQAQCATAQNIPACGDELSCLCSNEMGQGVVDCGNCGINYSQGDPNINAQFEAGIKAYTDSCEQAGHPVGTLSDTINPGSGSGGSGNNPTTSS
ncbi:unnamed protein product [Rhizoctonia solani]|uniref:Extracellular membrane protein CFEM domain-containing protein n=1 Tax=Rhizoctonia solani TaxID=456999 RepID=A0A8H3BVD5_9AGAM|nr:unnamed protein product [Rhizoctonia solani]